MSTIPREELENNLKKIFEYLPPLAICSSGVTEENKKLNYFRINFKISIVI